MDRVMNFIKDNVSFWAISIRKYIHFFHSGAEPDSEELEPIHCNLGLTLRQRNYSPVWDFLPSLLASTVVGFNHWKGEVETILHLCGEISKT